MAYQIPEDISSFSEEELNEALTNVVAEFESLGKLSDDKITDDDFARMEELSNFAGVVKGAQESKATAAAERAEKLASMRDAMAKKDEEEEEGKVPEKEAPADETPSDEAPAEATEVEAEVPAEGEPAPAEEIIEELPAPTEDEEEEKKEKEAVVASSGNSIANTARNSAKPEIPASKVENFSIKAAADIPQVSAGTKYGSLKEAAGAITNALKALPSGGQSGINLRRNALIIENTNAKFSQTHNSDDMKMLLDASNESTLKGGSLVAAGGWGAPSDTLLDFCDLESADGLIDLAEVSVTRGGLRYTKGPSFADVLASDSGFWDMTETVAEAGEELKTSIRPEVPPFVEKRLDAVGTMMEAGLLLRAGWPELVERYAAMTLLAHEIKMHLKKIAGIQDYTGAAIDITGGFGNAIDVLNIIDLVAAGERQRYSLANNATLEVLLPLWVRNVIRADLGNRNGVDFLSITDAQIDAYFSARKLRVQFLNHYQGLDIATDGIATAYPETLEVIMYPAGTYVAGVADVLTLDTVYDSVNLKKNDYVHLFTEQGLAVVNPCNEGRRFSFALAITGRTGAADITQPFGTEAAGG